MTLDIVLTPCISYRDSSHFLDPLRFEKGYNLAEKP
jgi:hypothetical protein